MSGRGRTWLLTLGLLGIGVVASAAPTISISSPASGATLHSYPVPALTVTVNYSSSGAALDLSTLILQINGVSCPGQLTSAPSSATCVVNQVPAGQVMIDTSIQDTAAVQASASRTAIVLPSLQDAQTQPALVGDELTITAYGLDPIPANNTLLFFNALDATSDVQAVFETADPTGHTGTVKVPAGAFSGPIILAVNQKQSPETPFFQLKTPIPDCGSVWEARFMADGGVLVHYSGSGPDPHCPAVTGGYVGRVHPDQTIDVIAQGDANTGIVAMVLDKDLTTPYVITRATNPGDFYFDLTTLYYQKPGSSIVSVTLGQSSQGNNDGYNPLEVGGVVPADVDPDGNLYVLYTENPNSPTPTIALGSIDPQTGARTAINTSLNPGGFNFDPSLVVGCDGFAYVGLNQSESFQSGVPPTYVASMIEQVDVTTGQVVAQSPVTENAYLLHQAVDCNKNELWASVMYDVSNVDIQAARVTIDGSSISGPNVEAQIDFAYSNSDITIGPDGTVYLRNFPNPDDWSKQYLVPFPGLVTLPLGATSALPKCGKSKDIQILPSTTRWKPQRGDDPITVQFAGPDNLDLQSGVLEITGPGNVGTLTVSGPITQTSPTGPFTYSVQWTGPWTYTDPSDSHVKRLPAGDYSVVVKATPQGGTQVQSPPYAKVSLVEVNSIELVQCGTVPWVICGDGGAKLDNNVRSDGTAMPGGGLAVFPDADPGGNYKRTVLVKVTLTPDLGSDINQVTVQFASIDVDDPSSNTAPIDDDPHQTTSSDNRRDDASLTTSANGNPNLPGAVAFFRVSTAQGNNYRLAASTFGPWLQGISGVVSSQNGDVTHASGEALTEGVQVSKMLTVWRTLHLEVDRMDPAAAGVTQQALDQQRDWTDLKTGSRGSRMINRSTGVFDPIHDANDDWVGAQLSLDFHSEDSYLVTGNLSDRVDVAVPSGNAGLLNGQKVGSITVRGYTLRDDELQRFLDVPLDTTMLAGLLEQVYVRLESHSADSINPNTSFPWTRVITASVAQAGPRDTTSSKPFWAVPLDLAFEGTSDVSSLTARENERRDTADPSNYSIPIKGGTARYFGGLLGVTIPGQGGNLTQPRSLSFLETIRDYKETNTTPAKATVSLADIYASNAAHETLHSLTLPHAGGIMCATRKNNASDPMRFSLTPTQLSLLRDIEQPSWPTQPDRTCGINGAAPPDCCP